MTSVLIDGAHFLNKTATGIGSYARTLAATLRDAGCDVAVLYGQRIQMRRESPMALATQVFGNEPPVDRRIRLLRDVPFLLRAAAGGGKRTRAMNVPIDGVDLSAFEPALPPADRVFNAHGIFERAQRLFVMKGRFTEVEVPLACKAAHWTGPMPIKARRMPNIYTVHDLIPLQFPHFVIDIAGRSAELHAAIARDADHIITDSQASKRSIMQLLDVGEDRVSVAYPPVPSQPELEREAAERLVEGLYGARPGAYALYVGAIEPRKNLKRLIEAFLIARIDVPLLIVGPLGWLYDEDVMLIEAIARNWQGVESPVRRLGHVPRRHLLALLQGARFLVFPSIYEGFGLPVLEAMQLGVPVLTSRTSSLPEVAGDAAVLIDPLNVSEMASAIERLGNDRDLRAELARRGPMQAAKFSREHFRQQLAAAYRKVGLEIQCGQPERRPLQMEVPQGGSLRPHSRADQPAPSVAG